MELKDYTIEEKAKAYDEALERARKLKENPKAIFFEEKNVNVSDYIFPELKESEDEIIRKDIISFLRSKNGYMNPDEDWDFHNRWLPWLENQGEQILANSAKTCKDEQKHAWSEEDEKNIACYNPYKEVVESIAEMCKHYDKASHSGLRDFYDNVKVKCKDAKEYDSLFPQSTWMPSDEQMEALADFIYAKYPNTEKYGAAVESLYQDLRKLKEK